MVDIVQSQGGLDILAGNFLHALQLTQQLKQQKEQLDLERQRTQASIGSEQANAGEARARTKQLELQADDLEAAQAGTRLAMGHLADLGDDKAFATALQGVDPQVAAHALTARNMLLKGQTDVLESRAQLKETEARTQALADEHTLNQQILPTVQGLLANPSAPLPTNPNTAQAIGMSRLGVLSYITQRMERERQAAGENAQADLAARQAVMQAYQSAQQLQVERRLRGDTTAFGVDFQAALQPLGVDTTQAQGMIKESLQSFMKRHAVVGGNGAPLTAPAALEPMFNTPRYKNASAAERSQLLDAAYGVAAKKPLSSALDDDTRTWIIRAAHLLTLSRNKRQAP